MNLAPSVLKTEFHTSLAVVRLVVLVVNSPGHRRRFPPAVIRTWLGSSFCGQKFITNLQYVTALPRRMLVFSLCDMTKMELVPFVPVFISPCAIRPTSLCNPVSHISLRSGSFANFLYYLIVSPMTGCTTGAEKCSMSTLYGACFGCWRFSGTHAELISS